VAGSPDLGVVEGVEAAFGVGAAIPVAVPLLPDVVVVVLATRTAVVVVGRGRVVVVVLVDVVVVEGGLIVSTHRRSVPQAESRSETASTAGTNRILRSVTGGRR
jgi:hypothetical protein